MTGHGLAKIPDRAWNLVTIADDLIKGAIFITATSALGAVQVSRVYHYIRGEAIIKL